VGPCVAAQQEAGEHEGRPLGAGDLDLPGRLHAGDVGLAMAAARRQEHHQARPGEENGKQAQTFRQSV
jgi:hypothetical protein